MRISDWSSDVCSSDVILETAEPRKNIGNLTRARHAHAVDGTIVPAMYRISVQKNLAGRRPKQTRNQMKQRGLSRAVGSDDGVTLTEIGRASCRERVCQYV